MNTGAILCVVRYRLLYQVIVLNVEDEIEKRGNFSLYYFVSRDAQRGQATASLLKLASTDTIKTDTTGTRRLNY